EIDDRILVRIKHGHVKQIAGAMQKSGVIDFCIRMDAFFVEAREGRRGSDAVEAVTVIQDAELHRTGYLARLKRTSQEEGLAPADGRSGGKPPFLTCSSHAGQKH